MAPDPTDLLEAVVLGGSPTYTRADLIRLSGVPDDLARALWRALGFPDTGGAAAFTEADLDALRLVWALIEEGLLDEETAVVLARSLGQSTARLADWQAEAVGRLLVEQEHLEGRDVAEDPEVVERILARTASLVEPMERLLDYAWRRQLAAVLDRRLARTEVIGEPSADGTVGFADLVGFTRLSRQLEDADLAALVEGFEAVSADVVASTGATLVKTVGDEILFIADDAGVAAETAMGLHAAHARDPDVPQMRVGLASGPVLRRMGDVFGSTVNLASRLTALARPDTTLVDAASAAQLAQLPGMGLRQLAPRRVRGLGVIRVFELRRP
ncbi:MAG: adenylate/guanylate cyclase domain-containing protein [Actinobacteria bacterium]|nr:adenylate/guanylate cyclase domain-containing protein [Actinomycetota bacterium]